MPSPIAGPRCAVVLLALAVAALCLDQPVWTQNRPGARRHTVVGGHEAAACEVLVKYRDHRGKPQQTRVEGLSDADEVEAINHRGLRRLHSRRFRTDELLALLRSDPDVEYAEPNYVVRATALPNDPSFGSLWGLLNTGFNPVGGGGLSGADIDVVSAWAATTGSRDAVIGVVDTGIDYNHPDLAANVWTAPRAFRQLRPPVDLLELRQDIGSPGCSRHGDPLDDPQRQLHDAAGNVYGNTPCCRRGPSYACSLLADDRTAEVTRDRQR